MTGRFRIPCLLALLLPGALLAQSEVLIYRCTDAYGHDTYQDSACPQNSFQHIIRMQRPSEPPPATRPVAPAAPIAPVAPPPPPEAQAPPPAQAGEAGAPPRNFSLPPWESEESLNPAPPPEPGPQVRRMAPGAADPLPALWRCRGLDKKPYLSDTDKPPPKCYSYADLGIDVSKMPAAARSGCQEVYDACERLPDRDVCEHLKLKASEAGLVGAKDEQARLAGTIAAHCAGP
jgi:hypothetical protein